MSLAIALSSCSPVIRSSVPRSGISPPYAPSAPGMKEKGSLGRVTAPASAIPARPHGSCRSRPWRGAGSWAGHSSVRARGVTHSLGGHGRRESPGGSREEGLSPPDDAYARTLRTTPGAVTFQLWMALR